jgi:hypothetical protein
MLWRFEICRIEIIPFDPDAVSSAVGKSSNLISGFHGKLSSKLFQKIITKVE